MGVLGVEEDAGLATAEGEERNQQWGRRGAEAHPIMSATFPQANYIPHTVHPPVPALLVGTYGWPVHPPLSPLCMHLWLALFIPSLLPIPTGTCGSPRSRVAPATPSASI
jgi:hypothetical protein